jgi:ABC-2 type transport system permease protein
VRNVTSSDESDEGERRRIGLLDLSGYVSDGSIAVAELQLFRDRQSGVSALLTKEVDSFFIVPGEYLNTGRVEWLHTGSAISAGLSTREDTGQVRALLRRELVTGKLPPSGEARFLSPANFESILVEEGGATKEGPQEASPLSISYIFAILLAISVVTGSGYLLQSVSEEKENRMIEVLLTSVSSWQMMVGKVLALGSVGLIQVLVWAASLALIGPRILGNFPQLGELNVDPSFVVWFVAFFLAGYFVLGVTMAAIGAATTSHREASQISMLMLMPAVMVPLWFFMIISGNPDGPIARTLSFIPLTAPITMIQRIGATDVPITEIVFSLVATVAGGVFLLWGSARIFRAGLLMYGQRMTLRSVLRALRQSGG